MALPLISVNRVQKHGFPTGSSLLNKMRIIVKHEIYLMDYKDILATANSTAEMNLCESYRGWLCLPGSVLALTVDTLDCCPVHVMMHATLATHAHTAAT